MSEYAVVTGATGALGSAIVACLRSAGLQVVAVARSRPDLERLASGDDGVVPVAADLADDAATASVAAALDGRVRIVVHAAGLPPSGTVETITADEITRGMDVKIGGLLRLLRAVEPHLGDGSRIVVLGGHYGYEPSPAAPLAGMVNAALVQPDARPRRPLGTAPGVTVHLIAPGPVESPRMQTIAERTAGRRGGGMTADDVLDEYRAGSPLGRLTTIEEVAWAVGILLAPEACRAPRRDACRSTSAGGEGSASRAVPPRRPRRAGRRPSSRPPCFVAPLSCSPRSPRRRSTASAPRSTSWTPTRSRSAASRSPSRECRRRSSRSTCSRVGRSNNTRRWSIACQRSSPSSSESRSIVCGFASTRSRPPTGASPACPRASCVAPRSSRDSEPNRVNRRS